MMYGDLGWSIEDSSQGREKISRGTRTLQPGILEEPEELRLVDGSCMILITLGNAAFCCLLPGLPKKTGRSYGVCIQHRDSCSALLSPQRLLRSSFQCHICRQAFYGFAILVPPCKSDAGKCLFFDTGINPPEHHITLTNGTTEVIGKAVLAESQLILGPLQRNSPLGRVSIQNLSSQTPHKMETPQIWHTRGKELRLNLLWSSSHQYYLVLCGILLFLQLHNICEVSPVGLDINGPKFLALQSTQDRTGWEKSFNDLTNEQVRIARRMNQSGVG